MYSIRLPNCSAWIQCKKKKKQCKEKRSSLKPFCVLDAGDEVKCFKESR